jgi:hypothetical protein
MNQMFAFFLSPRLWHQLVSNHQFCDDEAKTFENVLLNPTSFIKLFIVYKE